MKPDARVMEQKLDRVIELLEDTFILRAVVADMNREELRKIVKVDKKRINKISKHVAISKARINE
jgi:hypothetical protein